MRTLYYVPQSEFRRLSDANIPPDKRRDLFAGMIRINQLACAEKHGIRIDEGQQIAAGILSWLFLSAHQSDNSDAQKPTVVIDMESTDPALRAIQYATGITNELFSDSASPA